MLAARLAHGIGIAGAAACVLAAAAIAAQVPAGAASSGTVVSATVPSAITLNDQCGAAAARNIGTVLPGSGGISATGSSVCRFTFSSSNSSSMLRLYQADTSGDAMIANPTSWSELMPNGNPAMRFISGFGSLVYAIPANAGGQTYNWSTDGGATWLTHTPGGAHYPDVSVPSATVAWRFRAGAAQRSNDANANPGPPTWSAVSGNLVGGGTWSGYDGVDAVDYDTAWIVNGSTVYRTINPVAAEPWEPRGTGCTNADQIDALDANTAFTNGSGRICRTTNGNASWTQLTSGIPAGVLITDVAISPQTNTTIWATAANGTVLRSTNNGTNWSSFSLPIQTAPRTMQVISDAELYVAGDDGFVYRTVNSASSWTRIRTAVTSDITGMHVVSASTIVHNTGGSGWFRTADGGVTWTRTAGSTSDTLADLDAVNDDVIVAAKGDGLTYVTTNGGTTWNDRATGFAPDNVRGVAVVDDDTFIAVGDRGNIAITDDAGLTWTQRSSGTTEDLWDVDIDPAGVAIAVGATGTILRSTDGGWNWTTRSSSGNDLRRVVIRPSGLAVAVGLGGAIRRSTDGGVNWTTPTSGTTANLDAIQLPSDTVAYASTAGTLFKSTDAGATWTPITLSNSFRYVAAVNENILYVSRGTQSGWTQVVARSDDGGLTWSNPFSNANPKVRSVLAIDGGRVLFGSWNDWIRITAPATGVSDYGGANTWAAGGMFGACLQDVGGTASIGAWTEDASGTPGRCEASDADPWNAVPIAAVKIAQLASAGTGSVDLVWGMRAPSGQAPATYTAGVVVEAVAPNA